MKQLSARPCSSAAICALASSTADTSFFASASRAAARLNSVKSVNASLLYMCGSIYVRLGGLFDDLRHDKEMIFARRRIGDDLIGNIAVIDDIGALIEVHRHDGCHRLDAAHIHAAQFLDKGEDRIQFVGEMRNLRIAELDPRQMGNAADGRLINSHEIS